jgi:predicted metal-binding membrane protein
VDGVAPQSALDRGIEAALQRDRWLVAASLVLLVGLAWLYLGRDAAAMSQMETAGASMGVAPHTAGAGTLLMVFLMWTIMMVGMMLPSAAPAILLYGALVRKNGERGTVLAAVWVFTSGYLAAWAGFSLAAALLQVALDRMALMAPIMESASAGLSAAVLLAAGIYQWLPLKEACLRKCRHPIEFFATRWRSGARGAFRMGLEHGGYCVGCCWGLMLLLLAAGVMNLVWVALIAGFVLAEKLLPAARFTSRFAGAALVLSGLVVLLRA